MDRQLSDKLSVVRGYSALVVLFAHVNQWFILPLTGLETTGRYIWNALSHYSVLIFFILSGFVITHSLLKNLGKNGRIREDVFIRSRALRILPPFLVAMAFSIFVSLFIQCFHFHGAMSFKTPADLWVARDNVQLNLRDVLATAFFSNGIIPGTAAIITNGVLWSLSYEIWLYCLALLVALVCEPASFHRRIVALMALAGFALLFSGNSIFLEYTAYWALGAVISLYLHFNKKWRFFPGILTLAALPGLIICLVSPTRLWPLHHGGYALPINFSVLIIFTGIFRLLLNSNLGLIGHLGIHLSRSSYTLYIIHFPILLLLFSFFHLKFLAWGGLPRALFISLTIILIVLVADRLALVLENRKLWNNWAAALGEKIRNRRASSAAVRPALQARKN